MPTTTASLVEAGERMLVVVAHPDDESFGCGSVIARAVADGATVAVASTSLGERGDTAAGFDLGGRPLADVRRAELQTAAELLGATCLPPLGFTDSGWDGPPAPGSIGATPLERLTGAITTVVTDQRPDVVVTLAGDDGHRDHVRVRTAVELAVAAAPPRLYRWCLPNELMRRWAEQMRRLRPDTAHLALQVSTLGTAPDQVTDVIDTTDQLPARRRAMAAHASQTSPYDGLPDELAEAFLSRDHLVRIT